MNISSPSPLHFYLFFSTLVTISKHAYTTEEKSLDKNLQMILINNYLQAKVGKHKELETVLQSLRGKNANISEEAAEIIVNPSTQYSLR